MGVWVGLLSVVAVVMSGVALALAHVAWRSSRVDLTDVPEDMDGSASMWPLFVTRQLRRFAISPS